MNLKKVFSLDIKYSFLQAFYWMAFCSMMGYSSIYLLDKGFSNFSIGIILSLANISAVILQPVLASFADSKNKISLRNLINICILIILIMAVILCFIKDSTLIAVLVVAIFTVLLVIQPLVNAMAFMFEKHGISINFGLARGIGSVAYALISVVLGNVMAAYNPSILPFFYIGLMGILLVFVYSFTIKKKDMIIESKIENTGNLEAEEQEQEKPLSIVEFIKKYSSFMIFLLGVVCIFFEHNIINNFFIQIITNVDGTSADMGNAIFLAAMLELPTMLYFSRLKERINCGTLLKISGIFFTIKHVLTFVANSVFMIYFAQVFQIAAYAIFIPASVYYVSQLLDKKDLIKGKRW